jgi:hypothetical protein
MNKRPSDDYAQMPHTRVCGIELLSWAPVLTTPGRPLDDADVSDAKRIDDVGPSTAQEFSLEDVRRILAVNLQAREAELQMAYDTHLQTLLTQQYAAFTQWSTEQTSALVEMNYLS